MLSKHRSESILNTIVILNYNSFSLTKRIVKKVSSFKDLSIVVVDNCSNKGSITELLNLKIDNEIFDVIETKQNLGYAYGNNFGIRFALKKYPNIRNVFIANPDNHKSVGLATGRVIDNKGNIAKNNFWKSFQISNFLLQPFLLISKIYNDIFYDMYYKRNIIEINNSSVFYPDVITGCFFAIKVDVLKKIDFFDEDTFLFYEEEILFHKVKKIGLKSAVLLDLRIHHLESATINSEFRSFFKKQKLYNDSALVVLSKYLNASKSLLMLFSLLNIIGNIEKYIYISIKEYMMKWRVV